MSIEDKPTRKDSLPSELVREVIHNAAGAEPPSALDRELIELAYANISETNARLSEVASEVEPDYELASDRLSGIWRSSPIGGPKVRKESPMAPHSQPQIRMEQYQTAVIQMARIISVLGWDVPAEEDTSLQALALRAGKIKTFLSQAGGEKLRSVAGERREEVGLVDLADVFAQVAGVAPEEEDGGAA